MYKNKIFEVKQFGVKCNIKEDIYYKLPNFFDTKTFYYFISNIFTTNILFYLYKILKKKALEK